MFTCLAMGGMGIFSVAKPMMSEVITCSKHQYILLLRDGADITGSAMVSGVQWSRAGVGYILIRSKLLVDLIVR